MNVYKMKGQAEGGAMKVEVKELKLENRPAPPYPSRLKTVDKETQVTPERDSVREQSRKCRSHVFLLKLRDNQNIFRKCNILCVKGIIQKRVFRKLREM